MIVSSGIGLSIFMYLKIEIRYSDLDFINSFRHYYQYYAFGLWGSIFGWFAGIFGLISWNDMDQRNGHVSCTLRIHGWSAAISVLIATIAGGWSSYCCYQFASIYVASDLECGEITCEQIYYLWIWENILLTCKYFINRITT